MTTPYASGITSGAVNATKIADGSVTDTEFQYLNGVTQNIQTQLDGKQAAGSYQVTLQTPIVLPASGSGNLDIVPTTGEILPRLLRYTPPDLTSFLTSVPVPNLVLNVCSDTNLKTGNVNNGNVNSNSLNAWLPLYTQGNATKLQQQITLIDATRPVKIETNVVVLVNQTHVGFRVVCNNGVTSSVVPGTINWKSSAASADDDTPTFCASVVHTPGGTGNLTYTIEAYVKARFGGVNPIAIFNPDLFGGNTNQSTLLLTEL